MATLGANEALRELHLLSRASFFIAVINGLEPDNLNVVLVICIHEIPLLELKVERSFERSKPPVSERNGNGKSGSWSH